MLGLISGRYHGRGQAKQGNVCEVNFNMYIIQLSHEKALGGCLGYIGDDDTIQIFRDDNKHLLTDQYI